ncbi:MAG: hypothetical protein ACM3JE_01895 [Betaproteobacteria bacterium]
MNTKTLALIIIFSALAVVLNLYGPKIPFPLYGFLYFQLWEIPIAVAFLYVGTTSGFIVAILNTLLLFVVFPGGLPTGPIYNFIAVLSMLAGIYLPYKIATLNCKAENLGQYLKHHLALITISATATGIALRVIVMTVVNLFALPQDYPIGFSMPLIEVYAFLPLGAIFNAIIAAYTIPTAILITAAIMVRR